MILNFYDYNDISLSGTLFLDYLHFVLMFISTLSLTNSVLVFSFIKYKNI